MAPYILIETLAHELTHARQQQIAVDMDLTQKHTFEELAQTDLGNFDYFMLGIELSLDEATSFALYRVSQTEKMAEINALKYLKRYIDINKKTFGGNSEITKKFEQLKHQILFSGTKKYKEDGKEHFVGTHGILTNEQVVLKGQSENLLKLIMLKNFYTNKILEFNNKKELLNNQINFLQSAFEENIITQEELDKNREKIEEKIKMFNYEISEAKDDIKYIKSVFMDTLENGALPKYFDKHDFDVLNILDAPKSQFSLPKWLRKDEIKYNKNKAEEAKKAKETSKNEKEDKNEQENKEIA